MKNCSSIVLNLIIFLFSFITLPAQNLKFYNYTIENGLSQNTIQAIAQDSVGYLWFGTQDGLSRFDGYHFKIFRSDASIPHAISDNFITALLWDNQHGLWIGTNSGGAALFNISANHFKIFKASNHKDSLNTYNILAIGMDKPGNILFGTPRGISIYFPKYKIFRNFDLCNGNNPVYVQTLFFDSSQNLWFGTVNNGFGKVDLYSRDTIIYHYITDHNFPVNVKSINEFTSNILILGTNDKGLLFFDIKKSRFIKTARIKKILDAIRTKYINCIFIDSKKRIWIGTDNEGLYLVEKQGEKIRHFQPRHFDYEGELKSNHIITIYEDRSGLIWIGTRDKGIMKLDPGRSGFEWYTFKEWNSKVPSSNIIRTIYSDQSDQIWIGSFGGGLILFNKNKKTYKRYFSRHTSSTLNNNFVSSLTKDRAGTLWIGTWGGGINLMRNGKIFKYYRHIPKQPFSLSNDFIQAISIDHHNRIWVGTEDGLNIYDPRIDGFHRFVHEEGNLLSISDNRIQSNCIKEDQFGFIWVGSWNGLNRFRINEKYEIMNMVHYFHNSDQNNSISGNRIISLLIDDTRKDTSLVWIGTYGNGITLLVRIKNHDTGKIDEQYYYLNHQNGLSNDIVYSLLMDDHHNIWCGTNNGLNRIQPNKNFDFKVDVFTVSNGLQSNQFFWGAAGRTVDGYMVFGGIIGINLFLPDKIKKNLYIPPITFTQIGIYRNGFKIFPPTSELHVYPDDKFINIQFSALDFTSPDENHYAYMVEGYHNQWIQIGSDHQVTLTNLPPGRYRFRVKGSNNNNVWNETGKSIVLIIYPAWWQTTYFYLAMILSLGILIFVIVKVRTHNIRQRNKMLQEFNQKLNQQIVEKEMLQKQIVQMQKLESIGILAGGIAHDFNNILTVIRGHAELGLIRKTMEKIKTDLEIILHNTDRAINLIKQLLAFSKKETIQPEVLQLNDTIESLMTMLERVIGEDIRIETQLAPNLPEIFADKGQIEQILMNLIINARDAIHSYPGKKEQKISISTSFKKIPDNEKQRYPGLSGQEVVILKVSDSGIGISPEFLDKIFDPFFTTKGPDKGTGLGLATVYGIIRQNKGYIDVESEPGQGTSFTIYWPILKSDKPVNQKKSTDSSTIIKGNGTILLIEDEENVLNFTSSSLEELGYKVRSYNNGLEALKDFENNCSGFNLVITDLVMPDLNGREVAEKIRTINPDIPILIVSGYADDHISQEDIQTFGYYFLRKPFTIEELSMMIHQILNK